MNIILYPIEEHCLRAIPTGSVFEFEETLYLKVSPIDEYSNNCVRLIDGFLTKRDNNAVVRKIKGAFVQGYAKKLP